MHDDPTQIAQPPAHALNTLATGATHAAGPASGGTRFQPPASAARTTVLPQVRSEGGELSLALSARGRYQTVKMLGAGGMGEVILASDQDIDRKVAVKRLLPELDDVALIARFVDEIRTVGRLEHPNIVPIHDVGVDEEGRYFFVMKYVEGETLETIIEKLAAGDEDYLARYTVEVRIEIFLGLLHALEYAHARGIVHRDIKPANVMVGKYGEVVLMDWGIAKPLDAARDPASHPARMIIASAEEQPRSRLYATRVGSLIGTPAYMSPEQTRGDSAAVDARSDLYSAMVLFHELFTLKHYMAEKETTEAMFEGIRSAEVGFMQILQSPGKPPAELVHLIKKGLEKDPARRFQAAGEIIAVLHMILDGRVRVQCHVTFTKRIFRELGRVVDRRPMLGFFMLAGLLAAVGFSLLQIARHLLA